MLLWSCEEDIKQFCVKWDAKNRHNDNYYFLK